MAALATTSSLNNYPRLSISSYRDQLRIAQPDSLPVSYSYRGKHYTTLSTYRPQHRITVAHGTGSDAHHAAKEYQCFIVQVITSVGIA